MRTPLACQLESRSRAAKKMVRMQSYSGSPRCGLVVDGDLMPSLVAASLPVLVGGLLYVVAGLLTSAQQVDVPG